MKKLQILGTGCPKCKKLADLTEKAAKAAGIDFELEKVNRRQRDNEIRRDDDAGIGC